MSGAANTSGPGIRILIAEDNLINQKLVLQLLKRQGHHVDVAMNGEEAVELFRRSPYPLVLMDAQMPEMDGYEATRRIRTRREGLPQPFIIAMTAHAMQGASEKCLAAGMNDYISKPIVFEMLAAALARGLPAFRSTG